MIPKYLLLIKYPESNQYLVRYSSNDRSELEKRLREMKKINPKIEGYTKKNW